MRFPTRSNRPTSFLYEQGYVFKEFLKFWLFSVVMTLLAGYGVVQLVKEPFKTTSLTPPPAMTMNGQPSTPSNQVVVDKQALETYVRNTNAAASKLASEYRATSDAFQRAMFLSLSFQMLIMVAVALSAIWGVGPLHELCHYCVANTVGFGVCALLRANAYFSVNDFESGSSFLTMALVAIVLGVGLRAGLPYILPRKG